MCVRIKQPITIEATATPSRFLTTMEQTKLFIFALACFNLVLYAARAIVAGQTLNDEIYIESGDYPNDFGAWSDVFLIVYTLPACTTGGAASVFTLIHVFEWTKASRLVALGLAILGLFADFLDMSHAAKQWQQGSWDEEMYDAESLDARLHFVGVAAVVGAFTQMLMVAALFFFKLTTTTNDQVEEGELTDEHHEDEEVPMPEKE